MKARTPMLQQYFSIKAERPEALLAMRVGDFYEFYGEDAEIAARALEITLTGRDDGGERIAMAGVPFHSVEKYLARLVQQGLKVALCDQLEDPKAAKGLVKRGVTRVLTPGTIMEDSLLAASSNNYLVSICISDGKAGIASLDPSTGEFLATEVGGADVIDRLIQELARLRPAELLTTPDSEDVKNIIQTLLGLQPTEWKSDRIDRAVRMLQEQFNVSNLAGYGLDDRPAATMAASMILSYADRAKLPLDHVMGLSTYQVDAFMRIDAATRRALELSQSMTDGSRKHTLLGVLDEAVTPMGSRMIRKWVEQPLLDRNTLLERQESVARLHRNPIPRGDLRDALKRLGDLERLVSRTCANLASPRDLGALRDSLLAIPGLQGPLFKLGEGRIQALREKLVDHRPLAEKLNVALMPDLPAHLRDGGVIRPGHDTELDHLKELGKNGKNYIVALESQERAATGISTLKVGFNSVFGYYLEVGKAHLNKVPSHYIRKQTTASAERFITAELKEHESLVLGAEEKAIALEQDLFQRLRAAIIEQAAGLLQTAQALAEIDALAGLAEVASRRGYCLPELVEEDVLEIDGGRHPVVEATSKSFVPNSLKLGERRLIVLTGPNMSGKSTYLRQIALIVLMAQMGSFVPAKSAKIGLCDRIFARIGAKDELALGQSTFMVEMVESANILNHATDRSLVILDEVGRGTSTFDGLAIAWSMVEYLAEMGTKALFATHYHQLNALADQIPTIANFCVAVDERGDDIIWTHRVIPGGTNRSYGIHVARMAGLPPSVLRRAAEVLDELEDRSEAPPVSKTAPTYQLTLFEAEEPPVVRQLKELDVNSMTPLDALRWLDEAKRGLK
jgi:DNA mismatch repair protein MutS